MMATPISSSFSFSFSFSSIIGFLSSALLASLFLIICSSNKLEGSAALASSTGESGHYHTVQISSILPPSVCSPSTKGESKSGGSVLQVVHRHGPCSRLGLDKASAPPSAAEILAHDQSRVNSIHTRLGINAGRNSLQGSKATLPATTGTTLGTGNYIVTVGLGTPKKQLSLIFDTGSDLTWTQCKPCVRFCYQQQEPTFDPILSKTYKNVSCSSGQCNQLATATGNTPGCNINTCIYGIQYGDSSYSVGYFGTETLALTPTDAFPNFFFGCGQNNRGLFGSAAGLLGLGRDQLSVVSQTASKYGKYFSYCLPSRGSSSGYLSFGKGAGSNALQYTSLLTNSQSASFYGLSITAIKVGSQVLSIPQSVFKNAETIIDSGTVITRLPPGAYSVMRTAFRQLMTKYPTAQALSILDTCYDFSKYTTISIPKISFFFGSNVEVPIAASGIVYAGSPSQVCLAFAGNSAATDVGIFGNVQQQTLQVAYDVAGGKIGFGPRGC